MKTSHLGVLAPLVVTIAAACSAPPEGALGSTAEAVAGGALETWNGVTAHVYGGNCSAVYATSGTGVHYGPPGVLTDTCGFQCVELAVRYFHFNEGIPASTWSIPTAIDMCANHPAGVVATSSPVAGDLMVYLANDPYYGTGSAGHVAVIRGVHGDGSLDVFNQRWASESTAFANGILRNHAACFLHSVHNAGGGGGPPPPKPPAPSGCGTIKAGQGLERGTSFASCDGTFSLAMQSDGNLVLYLGGGHALWSSGTAGSGGVVAVMQTDGNLVVYDGSDRPVWADGRAGHSGSSLVVQNDGNLVEYGSNGAVLWASGTNIPAPNAPSSCGGLAGGQGLARGRSVSSCDGSHLFAMQGDGNLVLYAHGKATWASHGDGSAAYDAEMQSDGNLVVYDPWRRPLWASGTAGHAGSRLAVQDDGNVVVYDASGRALWATGTNGK